jgi:uncharacterized protein
MTARPWAATAGGVILTVRLTPKGGRDAIDGIEATADGKSVLKVRVRAAPSEGEANDALVRLIAKVAGVPPRAVLAAEAPENRRFGHCAGRSAGENPSERVMIVLGKRGA